MPLVWVTFSPALFALVLVVQPRRWFSGWVALVPAVIFGFLALQMPLTQPIVNHVEWVPSLGVSLEFLMDGLGYVFALIITGIGTLILVYAYGYFDDRADYVRFSAYTLMFMSAMLGVVLSGNLLLLFVFWELTSVTSYLLIGFKHEKESAREGARRALLITAGGGLALLAGLIMLGIAAGTFELSELTTLRDQVQSSELYIPAVVLILIGAMTKSAQWPFHFWLPGAMEAPTPASAYLHSATMVKAGVFLLARLSGVLGGTDVWLYSVTGIGLITFVYGGLFALRQLDLKGILAYSTLSWLGALVALIGLGTKDGFKALIVGVLAHALYKCALFLTAGSIDHATGTRDISRLGGLARVMRWSFMGGLIAAVSMAGIPPLLGFLGKETLKVASLAGDLSPVLNLLFPVVAVVGSALTVTAAFRLLWDSFLRSPSKSLPHHLHEVSVLMWIGPLLLGVLSLVLPFVLEQVVDPLLNPALTAITGEPSSEHLHLFEGINTPFLMSMGAIALGLALFWVRHPVVDWLRSHREFNPDGLYQMWLRGLPETAQWVTVRLQNGRLRFYIAVLMCVIIVVGLSTVFLGNLSLVSTEARIPLDWEVVFVCTLLVIGAVAVVLAPTRLSAIVVLGIEGALLSLTFALFGAPDLAFTQLMIEVVSLVLFVLAFHFLPDAFVTQASRLMHLRDVLVAVGVGITMTLLVLVANANVIGPSISPWYVDNSVPEGQGYNVVNVILVDFRGLDTQGEIIVLVIAAMGVAALLRLRPTGQPRGRFMVSEQTDAESEADNQPAVTAEQQPRRQMEGDA